MIPGVNILGMALTLISSQSAMHFKYIGRVPLDNGVMVSKFAEGVECDEGSVQAVNRENYEWRGLEFAKDYVDWFVPRDVLGLSRDYSGDEMEWEGKRWKVLSVERWSPQDGWVQLLMVETRQ